MSDQTHEANNPELLDALANRIGSLVIQCEMLDRVVQQQAAKIRELEFALTKVAEGLNSNAG
jgi:hypothetical protein